MKHYRYLILSLLGLFFTFEVFAQRGNHLYTEGYKADLQICYQFRRSASMCSINTSHGYGFGNGLYLGGGSGIGLNSIDYGEGSRVMIPVFGNLKYSFIDSFISPYIDFKAGIIGDLTSKGIGYMINPNIGLDFKRFSLGIGINKIMLDYGNIARGNTSINLALSYNF